MKILKETLNDFDQYSRRDYVEISGLPSKNYEDTNNIVMQVAKEIGVEMKMRDISTSHRLPRRSNSNIDTNDGSNPIIEKFIRRDVKEKFYRARKYLKGMMAADLGYQVPNKIFINENLSQKNKELFQLLSCAQGAIIHC